MISYSLIALLRQEGVAPSADLRIDQRKKQLKRLICQTAKNPEELNTLERQTANFISRKAKVNPGEIKNYYP